MSLYRKYRPQCFAEVMGQEHVVQTLRGAIESSQIGHAYIFTGIRGTGKTTVARIFAKAVNCLALKESEPCCECSVCKEISEGRFLDLIEIDAASNRGIDEIRDLKEKIRFAPNVGKYKVYIIDEAHMLTDQAFNALLKTLEEPPQHAIFILATTEIHKIPITILSRCQRLDFHRVKSHKMLEGIKRILEKEKIKIDDRSLKKIISISEGSVRDAQSYLDQVSAFAGGGEIKFELVEDILGYSKEEKLVDLLKPIFSKDIKAVVTFVNEFVETGGDLENLIKDVIRFLRKALMFKIGDEEGDIFENEKTKEIMGGVSLESLVLLIEVLNGVIKNSKFAFLPQLFLEIELIKFINSDEVVSHDKNEREIKTEGRFMPGKIISDIKNVLKSKQPEEEEKKEIVNIGGWEGFLEKLKKEKMVLYMALQGCEVNDNDGVISLGIYNEFYFKRLNEKINRDFIDEIFNKVYEGKKKLVIAKAEKKEKSKDLLKDALSVFGGELMD